MKAGVCFLLLIGLLPRLDLTAGESNDAAMDVLLERCVTCHHAKQASGGLDLTSNAAFLKGGDSGDAVDPSTPDKSYLLERIRTGEMPPEEKGVSQRLPDQEIEILEAWVKQGSHWPQDRKLDPFEKTTSHRAGRDWWSFQSIGHPAVPESP
ncbi:MAG: c-type cytochrome domain-containing protein, partial [Planctomycetota bacterium]|nr:c-type cytochrome domain-containing protein [Planctomycetota bacterium]